MENFLFCLFVQRGKGIVENVNRTAPCERPRKSKPLRLPAGEADAGAADDGLFLMLHRQYFLIETNGAKPRPDAAGAAHENIVFDGVVQQLRIMPEIPEECAADSPRKRRKFLPVYLHRAFIRVFAQKYFSEC